MAILPITLQDLAFAEKVFAHSGLPFTAVKKLNQIIFLSSFATGSELPADYIEGAEESYCLHRFEYVNDSASSPAENLEIQYDNFKTFRQALESFISHYMQAILDIAEDEAYEGKY